MRIKPDEFTRVTPLDQQFNHYFFSNPLSAGAPLNGEVSSHDLYYFLINYKDVCPVV